jgi:hypothetical protein
MKVISGYAAGAAAIALVFFGQNAIAQQSPTPGQPAAQRAQLLAQSCSRAPRFRRRCRPRCSGATRRLSRRRTGRNSSARYRGRTSPAIR